MRSRTSATLSARMATGLTDEELAKSAPGSKAGVTEAVASGAHDLTIPEVSAEPAPKPAAPVVPVKKVAARSEPALDDETKKFITQSLTDVDLFASYGLTQKAIGLLEAILRRAPRHTPTLEKLLDFVLGAGDDRRTAELAAQLEQIHKEGGDPRSSEQDSRMRS